MTDFAPSAAQTGGREFGPHAKPATPEQIKAKGEPTVTMVFTKKVLLTLPGYRRVQFNPGVHEVPASIANDRHAAEYLELNGVRRHTAEVAEQLPDLPDEVDADENEEEAEEEDALEASDQAETTASETKPTPPVGGRRRGR